MTVGGEKYSSWRITIQARITFMSLICSQGFLFVFKIKKKTQPYNLNISYMSAQTPLG